MKLDMENIVEMPEGVSAVIQDRSIIVKGPKGEVKRILDTPKIKVSVEGNTVKMKVVKGTKREKTLINTLEAHVYNMVEGVQKPWTYKLKVCASHFPMTVTVNGKDFSIKNMLGEKVPRAMKLRDGVTVKVTGQDITVESADKELAGLTAGHIERLSKVTNRDRRVFQDGVHMTEKCGVKIE